MRDFILATQISTHVASKKMSDLDKFNYLATQISTHVASRIGWILRLHISWQLRSLRMLHPSRSYRYKCVYSWQLRSLRMLHHNFTIQFSSIRPWQLRSLRMLHRDAKVPKCAPWAGNSDLYACCITPPPILTDQEQLATQISTHVASGFFHNFLYSFITGNSDLYACCIGKNAQILRLLIV